MSRSHELELRQRAGSAQACLSGAPPPLSGRAGNEEKAELYWPRCGSTPRKYQEAIVFFFMIPRSEKED
jgi:hypothetical protein